MYMLAAQSALQQQLDHELLVILLSVVLVLAASAVVFWALITRWTSRRRWVALSDWARPAGFRLQRAPNIRVSSLTLRAARPPLQPVLLLSDAQQNTTLVQSDGPARAAAPGASPENAAATIQRWNFLLRALPTAWPATALRPVSAAHAIADLFALESFPTLGAGERFLVCGEDKATARVLARSSVRSLLPKDIGLLLRGRELVLDFSARPFDEIEFGRMIALVDQLVVNLPASASAGSQA